MELRGTETTPKPTVDAALAALHAGQAADCERLARRALQEALQDPTWLTLLALALSQQQRADEALACYEQLTRLQPAVAEHWSNLGNCLC